jgi:hypothetical protein
MKYMYRGAIVPGEAVQVRYDVPGRQNRPTMVLADGECSDPAEAVLHVRVAEATVDELRDPKSRGFHLLLCEGAAADSAQEAAELRELGYGVSVGGAPAADALPVYSERPRFP